MYVVVLDINTFPCKPVLAADRAVVVQLLDIASEPGASAWMGVGQIFEVRGQEASIVYHAQGFLEHDACDVIERELAREQDPHLRRAFLRLQALVRALPKVPQAGDDELLARQA